MQHTCETNEITNDQLINRETYRWELWEGFSLRAKHVLRNPVGSF